MLLAFGYIWIGFLFCLVLIGAVWKETNLKLTKEKKILSEKIIIAKELMRMKSVHVYFPQTMHQVEAVLDYDFINHGVMKNFKEEELVKAIFKHAFNNPVSMDKLMNLSCTEDHARIYITAKCSKLIMHYNDVEKCKALYEKCQMV